MDVKKTLYQLLLENANSKDANIRKLCEKIGNQMNDDDKRVDESVIKSWIVQLEGLVANKKNSSTHLGEQTKTTSASNDAETEVRKRREKSEIEQLSEEKPHEEIVRKPKSVFIVCKDIIYTTFLTIFCLILLLRLIVASLKFAGFIK